MADDYEFEQYNTLSKVRNLSSALRPNVEAFVTSWNDAMEQKEITVPWWDSDFTYGAIMRHVIAHEIHHIGQLSVWAREIGLKPVTANLLGRGLLPAAR